MARFAFIALAVAGLAASASAATVLRQNDLQDVIGSNEPVQASSTWDWNDCGGDGFPVTIESIKLSPDPPEKGQDLDITVSGTVRKRVEEGAYAQVAVKIGLIKILQKEFDICDEARNSNLTVQCPLDEGKYTVEQVAQLPKEIPPGKFLVEVRGYTDDDEDLACVNINVDFRKRFLRLW